LIVDHKGKIIEITLENCLKEWWFKKICCVTIDSASAISVTISYLSIGLSVWSGQTLFNKEHMHTHGSTHILNLIG